jgi:glutathione S-transferase
MGNSGSAKHVDARDATVSEVYLQIDPPRPPSFNSIPHRTKGTAVILVSLFLCFGMPFFEPSFIQPHWTWGYEASVFAGLPRAYALVLLCNAVLPTFVMSYLAFGVVSQGRKKYGYKLPVMYASVDIHVLDVAAGGAILSDGNSMAAQQKLEAAAAYSTHQRAHHNALETLQLFLVLSLLGGLRYPVTTAIHGVCWAIGRVAWAAGYTSGNPIDRYSNPLANLIWFGLIGVIATTVGLAIGLLGGPV